VPASCPCKTFVIYVSILKHVIEVEIKSRIFFAETEIKPNEISIQIETCQIRTLVYSHKKRAVVKRQPPSNKK
jgi:hypothetical protein